MLTPIGAPHTIRTVTIVVTRKGIDYNASDLDGDGLTKLEELRKKTNPRKWDTDGDGKSDKEDRFPRDKNRH